MVFSTQIVFSFSSSFFIFCKSATQINKRMEFFAFRTLLNTHLIVWVVSTIWKQIYFVSFMFSILAVIIINWHYLLGTNAIGGATDTRSTKLYRNEHAFCYQRKKRRNPIFPKGNLMRRRKNGTHLFTGIKYA